jgi:hypothetical protein
MLTSTLRSGCLPAASVAAATQSRPPGVSSAAFRAQSPNLRFAPLMDMDFAVSSPLVRHWRLLSGFCPSTRTFAPRFLQTSPRGDSPCVIASSSPPSGWAEDFHLQAAEHAQHTTKPLRAAGGTTSAYAAKLLAASSTGPPRLAPPDLHSNEPEANTVDLCPRCKVGSMRMLEVLAPQAEASARAGVISLRVIQIDTS